MGLDSSSDDDLCSAVDNLLARENRLELRNKSYMEGLGMFEQFYASEFDSDVYSEAEMDRFNLYMEERLTGMDLDPDLDYERVAKEVKYLCDMYLTCDSEEWPF